MQAQTLLHFTVILSTNPLQTLLYPIVLSGDRIVGTTAAVRGLYIWVAGWKSFVTCVIIIIYPICNLHVQNLIHIQLQSL